MVKLIRESYGPGVCVLTGTSCEFPYASGIAVKDDARPRKTRFLCHDATASPADAPLALLLARRRARSTQNGCSSIHAVLHAASPPRCTQDKTWAPAPVNPGASARAVTTRHRDPAAACCARLGLQLSGHRCWAPGAVTPSTRRPLRTRLRRRRSRRRAAAAVLSYGTASETRSDSAMRIGAWINP